MQETPIRTIFGEVTDFLATNPTATCDYDKYRER